MSQVIAQQIPKQEHQFRQEFHSKQMEISKYQNVNEPKEKLCGHWNNQENIKYLVFIRSNIKLFGQNHQRKFWKIYKVMSLFIQTRNVHQCRNHHQKMIQKYHDLQNLIEELENLYPVKRIKQITKFYAQNHIQAIKQFTPKRIRRSQKSKAIKQSQKVQILPQQKNLKEKKQDEKIIVPKVQTEAKNIQMPSLIQANFMQAHQVYELMKTAAYLQQLQYMNAYIHYFGY